MVPFTHIDFHHSNTPSPSLIVRPFGCYPIIPSSFFFFKKNELKATSELFFADSWPVFVLKAFGPGT